MQPTYAAKYPPAQGVALALGEKLGLPIIGVWLATALACAAVCWMLLAWMPPRWALAGGLMVALHPQVLEWSQDYWGGAVAMGGGALVLGAFRRMLGQPRARDAVWMGVGLAVLANSRPYEGFVLGCPIADRAGDPVHGESATSPSPSSFARCLRRCPRCCCCWSRRSAIYNWRVTGNPTLMPYMAYEQTYGIAPVFLFGTPRPEPEYRHREIRNSTRVASLTSSGQRRSIGGFARATGDKIWLLAQGYLWSWLLAVALLGLPWALRRERWLWLGPAHRAVVWPRMLMSTWVFPHYAAPAAGLFFLLAVESLRCLRAFRLGTRRIGRGVVRGLAILFVISFVQIAAKISSKDTTLWYFQRQALLDKLRSEPGKSLLIVSYGPNHNPNREWVYNEADIIHAKVILAQDMGDKNKELLAWFPDRKCWLVRADDPKPALEAYP